MFVQGWVDVVSASFVNLWSIFIAFLPKLIGALIVFFVGWAIAVGVGHGVMRLIRASKLDNVLLAMGAEKAFTRAGIKVDSGRFLGEVVKWFLVIAFLLAASDILGLSEVSGFLREVLGYVPNIVIAVVILVLGVLVAAFLRGVVVASAVHSVGNAAAKMIGSVVKWAVLIFAIFAALAQLNVAPTFIQIVLTGVVAMLAIAGGLAFGLGGKDLAASWMKRVQDEIHR
ncbi:hypothetical protein C4553_02415 [Candidatus Parcubacteria bacterium]|nr:MAG: hypothetical protein C4553_02415 [Candidatus Parcubacteria bacterium]